MSDSKYDSVFEAVLRTVRYWRPRPKAKLDLSGLLALPPGHQVMKLRSLRRLQTATVAEALREASDEQRFNDPPLCLHLAGLAVDAARPAATGRGALGGGGVIERDVLADCLATQGNAHRIVGDTRRAERRLAEAGRVAQAGTGDPLLEAKIDRLTGVLLGDLRRLTAAMFYYVRCLESYEQLDEPKLAEQVRISMAQIHYRAGRSAKALNCIFQSLKNLNPQVDTTLVVAALSVAAAAHLDVGNADSALRKARVIQEVCAETGDRAGRIRAEWIEARALLALGHWQAGIDGLDRSREELLEIGALGAAAHAHLQLALAHAEACHWERAGSLAREAFGTLATAGLEGQALVALRTVARAAEGQRLTAAVLRQALGKVSANS